MRYFRGDFTDLMAGQSEVWRRQDAAGHPRSSFGSSADGSDTSTWTSDPDGEQLFREVLQASGVDFTEDDQQQVVTWLDGLLS